MKTMARPDGPGSCPDGPNPSVSVHSDCDPSRGDLIRALQQVMKLDDLSDIYDVAQAALDGLPEARTLRLAELSSDSAAVRYDAVNWLDRNRDERSMPALRERYLVEDNKTIRALLKAVLTDAAAQGMEARKGRGEDSVGDDSPVAEGDAPDPAQDSRLAAG